MKIFGFYLTGLLLMFLSTESQITLVLQPDSTHGKDCEIFSLLPTTNYKTNVLRGNAFTFDGEPGTERGLFQFDLSALPNNCTILSAKLSLFTPDSPHTQYQYGPNAAVIRRITSAWKEDSVTWGNQPSTTTLHQVLLDSSKSAYQDYPNIDVKQLVADMVANPLSSFGFMLRLQNETYYRRITFCSSDYPNAAKHPKLEITYSQNVALSEQAELYDVRISSNPTVDFIQVRYSGDSPVLIKIFDEFGVEKLRTVASSGTADLDLRTFPPQIYSLVLCNSDGKAIQIRKIIKL
jgi:hypothetical protein